MPPPRIQLPSGIQAGWSIPRSSGQVRFASTVQQRRRKHQDPYALAQARARKANNLSRRATLETTRSKALGDPVYGVTTAFVQSFDTGLSLSDDPKTSASPLDPPDSSPDSASPDGPASSGPEHLNQFISAAALRSSLNFSENLTKPTRTRNPLEDPQEKDKAFERHATEAENARIAMSRIAAIDNASASSRFRVNVQRCIDTFGRHNTDAVLQPRPGLAEHPEADRRRAGPDTGSSEVQVAILTARIRALTGALETRGKHDKVNKRNLRLLVHRRQKLLQYLRKKERGGERWQNLVTTLGLTDATWKGEISL